MSPACRECGSAAGAGHACDESANARRASAIAADDAMGFLGALEVRPATADAEPDRLMRLRMAYDDELAEVVRWAVAGERQRVMAAHTLASREEKQKHATAWLNAERERWLHEDKLARLRREYEQEQQVMALRASCREAVERAEREGR